MKNLTVLGAVTLAASVITIVSLFSQENTVIPLKDGARVAMLGDNLTEQRVYTRFVDVYFHACAGLRNVQFFQFGRSWERIPACAGRAEREVAPWKPTVVTLLYGQQETNFESYKEPAGKVFRAGLDKTVKYFLDRKARVVICSPVPVDSQTFRGNKDGIADKVNAAIGKMSELAYQTAVDNKAAFADVTGPMLKVMAAAKAKYGKGYHLCGPDGYQPWGNGHLVIAYVLLKKFRLDGTIADIRLDMEGKKSTVSDGHKILTSAPGKLEIESTRYPFCFSAPRKTDDPGSPLSIMPFLPFQEEFNRFLLRVNGLTAAKAKVEWGKYSKVFPSEQLRNGINLAVEFRENPFSVPFDAVQRACINKQNFETDLFRRYMTAQADAARLGLSEEGKAAFVTVIRELWKTADLLNAKFEKAIVPVTHTIKITPL